jgi:hypothetical protein
MGNRFGSIYVWRIKKAAGMNFVCYNTGENTSPFSGKEDFAHFLARRWPASYGFVLLMVLFVLLKY